MLVLFGWKSRDMCRFLQGPANPSLMRVPSPKLHRQSFHPHLFSFEGPAADRRGDLVQISTTWSACCQFSALGDSL
jgi:hypothetical protein